MLYGHVVIKGRDYDLDDIAFNLDRVAKLVCRRHGVKHVFITSAPIEDIGGYHGQPTLKLENGKEIELWFDNPDVSDVFVWALETKLHAIHLHLSAIADYTAAD